MKQLIGLIVMFFLSMSFSTLLTSCAQPTIGKSVEPDISITITNNTGEINISPVVTSKSGDNENESSNATDVPIDLPINIPVTKLNPVQKLESAIETVTGNNIADAAEEILSPTPSNTDVYSMSVQHGRMFTWLNNTGAVFGDEVTFSVPDCDYELVVDDPLNNLITEQGRYFDGTHNKKESNGNLASFFAPIGCDATRLIVTY